MAKKPAMVLLNNKTKIKKTQLIKKTTKRTHETKAHMLINNCVKLNNKKLPFMPLADTLHSLMHITPPEQLDEFIEPAQLQLAHLVPKLDPQTTTSSSPPKKNETTRLLELVLNMIQQITTDHPLMLIIKNLHSTDHSTLDLMTLLVHALRNMRVLLIISFHSDKIHHNHPLRPLITNWKHMHSIQHVKLEQFTTKKIAGQLKTILNSPTPQQLIELMYNHSKNNAFLIKKILNAIQNNANPNQLPLSLHNVLLTHTKRLTTPTQQLLHIATTNKRSIPNQLLTTMASLNEPNLNAALHKTIEHQLLVVDKPNHNYIFQHTLTRNTIYKNTLPHQHVQIHSTYTNTLSTNPNLASTNTNNTMTTTLALH